MAEADKLKFVDQFTKFLNKIYTDLKSRGEVKKIPLSLLRLYVYCNKYVARNKGQLTQFKRFYKKCKEDLQPLAEEGGIYIL
ncbi:hypothetical protein HY637_05385 [Candidatus Woesearchaeota archaeon]|nr:hypothetical protein [Candidatus Woesearchaeota archaeon]